MGELELYPNQWLCVMVCLKGMGLVESYRQSKDVETREQGQAQLWGQGVISSLKRGHAGDDGVDVQL
jgi:hypothetical protein